MSDLLADTSTSLATLVRLLWHGGHQDDVRVTTGRVPAGLCAVERYVVVPNLRQARMLLPGDDRAVRAAALSHYNRLRQPRTRSLRAALALLARTGLDTRFATTVSICLPDRTGPQAEPDLLVTSMLAQRLGHRRLHAAIGVNRAGPNSKPTLQLFGSDGQPVAFVKVGWNRITRGLVNAEARALHGVGDDALPGIRRPRTLLHEQWHDLTLLATVAMPLDVRPVPHGAAPQERVHTALPQHSDLLGASAYWDGVLERWRGLRERADSSTRDLAVVDAYVAAVERRWASTSVDVGAWHGDWVSWNMARCGDQLWVWDWEHYAPLAPIGFDSAHFAFQQAFVAQQQPVARALGSARSAVVEPAEQRAVVAATYPLEIYLRAAHLNAEGAGWNVRFRDGVLDWLSATTQR